MNFEYDEKKSQANLKKHGLSLEDAKQLWRVVAVEISARRSRQEEEEIYQERIKR